MILTRAETSTAIIITDIIPVAMILFMHARAHASEMKRYLVDLLPISIDYIYLLLLQIVFNILKAHILALFARSWRCFRQIRLLSLICSSWQEQELASWRTRYGVPGTEASHPSLPNHRGVLGHVTRCRALIGHLAPGRRVARCTAAVTVTV